MKLSEQLKAKGVYNQHDLLSKFGKSGATDIGVSYSRRPDGRAGMCQCNHSQVYSPSHPTDPKAHWSNYGCKTFVGKRSESFPLALAWASKTYGIQEWANSPFISTERIPKSVLDAAKEFVK